MRKPKLHPHPAPTMNSISPVGMDRKNVSSPNAITAMMATKTANPASRTAMSAVGLKSGRPIGSASRYGSATADTREAA